MAGNHPSLSFWKAKEAIAKRFANRKPPVDVGTRDTLCRVLPGLYLSSCHLEAQADILRKHGVTHVLQVGRELSPTHPSAFTYKGVPIYDLEQEDIVEHFRECFEFMNNARETGAVLVHCAAGVSRSASMVIGYLMATGGMSLEAARAAVKASRPIINPNAGFLLQLQLFQQAGCSAEGWTPWSLERFLEVRAAVQSGDDATSAVAAAGGSAAAAAAASDDVRGACEVSPPELSLEDSVSPLNSPSTRPAAAGTERDRPSSSSGGGGGRRLGRGAGPRSSVAAWLVAEASDESHAETSAGGENIRMVAEGGSGAGEDKAAATQVAGPYPTALLKASAAAPEPSLPPQRYPPHPRHTITGIPDASSRSSWSHRSPAAQPQGQSGLQAHTRPHSSMRPSSQEGQAADAGFADQADPTAGGSTWGPHGVSGGEALGGAGERRLAKTTSLLTPCRVAADDYPRYCYGAHSYGNADSGGHSSSSGVVGMASDSVVTAAAALAQSPGAMRHAEALSSVSLTPPAGVGDASRYPHRNPVPPPPTPLPPQLHGQSPQLQPLLLQYPYHHHAPKPPGPRLTQLDEDRTDAAHIGLEVSEQAAIAATESAAVTTTSLRSSASSRRQGLRRSASDGLPDKVARALAATKQADGEEAAGAAAAMSFDSADGAGVDRAVEAAADHASGSGRAAGTGVMQAGFVTGGAAASRVCTDPGTPVPVFLRREAPAPPPATAYGHPIGSARTPHAHVSTDGAASSSCGCHPPEPGAHSEGDGGSSSKDSDGSSSTAAPSTSSSGHGEADGARSSPRSGAADAAKSTLSGLSGPYGADPTHPATALSTQQPILAPAGLERTPSRVPTLPGAPSGDASVSAAATSDAEDAGSGITGSIGLPLLLPYMRSDAEITHSRASSMGGGGGSNPASPHAQAQNPFATSSLSQPHEQQHPGQGRFLGSPGGLADQGVAAQQAAAGASGRPRAGGSRLATATFADRSSQSQSPGPTTTAADAAAAASETQAAGLSDAPISPNRPMSTPLLRLSLRGRHRSQPSSGGGGSSAGGGEESSSESDGGNGTPIHQRVLRSLSAFLGGGKVLASNSGGSPGSGGPDSGGGGGGVRGHRDQEAAEVGGVSTGYGDQAGPGAGAAGQGVMSDPGAVGEGDRMPMGAAFLGVASGACKEGGRGFSAAVNAVPSPPTPGDTTVPIRAHVLLSPAASDLLAEQAASVALTGSGRGSHWELQTDSAAGVAASGGPTGPTGQCSSSTPSTTGGDGAVPVPSTGGRGGNAAAANGRHLFRSQSSTPTCSSVAAGANRVVHGEQQRQGALSGSGVGGDGGVAVLPAVADAACSEPLQRLPLPLSSDGNPLLPGTSDSTLGFGLTHGKAVGQGEADGEEEELLAEIDVDSLPAAPFRWNAEEGESVVEAEDAARGSSSTNAREEAGTAAPALGTTILGAAAEASAATWIAPNQTMTTTTTVLPRRSSARHVSLDGSSTGAEAPQPPPRGSLTSWTRLLPATSSSCMAAADEPHAGPPAAAVASLTGTASSCSGLEDGPLSPLRLQQQQQQRHASYSFGTRDVVASVAATRWSGTACYGREGSGVIDGGIGPCAVTDAAATAAAEAAAAGRRPRSSYSGTRGLLSPSPMQLPQPPAADKGATTLPPWLLPPPSEALEVPRQSDLWPPPPLLPSTFTQPPRYPPLSSPLHPSPLSLPLPEVLPSPILAPRPQSLASTLASRGNDDASPASQAPQPSSAQTPGQTPTSESIRSNSSRSNFRFGSGLPSPAWGGSRSSAALMTMASELEGEQAAGSQQPLAGRAVQRHVSDGDGSGVARGGSGYHAIMGRATVRSTSVGSVAANAYAAAAAAAASTAVALEFGGGGASNDGVNNDVARAWEHLRAARQEQQQHNRQRQQWHHLQHQQQQLPTSISPEGSWSTHPPTPPASSPATSAHGTPYAFSNWPPTDLPNSAAFASVSPSPSPHASAAVSSACSPHALAAASPGNWDLLAPPAANSPRVGSAAGAASRASQSPSPASPVTSSLSSGRLGGGGGNRSGSASAVNSPRAAPAVAHSPAGETAKAETTAELRIPCIVTGGPSPTRSDGGGGGDSSAAIATVPPTSSSSAGAPPPQPDPSLLRPVIGRKLLPMPAPSRITASPYCTPRTGGETNPPPPPPPLFAPLETPLSLRVPLSPSSAWPLQTRPWGAAPGCDPDLMPDAADVTALIGAPLHDSLPFPPRRDSASHVNLRVLLPPEPHAATRTSFPSDAAITAAAVAGPAGSGSAGGTSPVAALGHRAA